MSRPAARLSDMHVCPMITVLVPHVGGPIVAGEPTTLMAGLPAARVGDFCVCVGPPDVIATGAFTVLIAGQPAARMGDMTAHGGAIVMGLPTVLIGDSGGDAGSPGVGAGVGSAQALTMQAARSEGAAFTRTNCAAETILARLADSPMLVAPPPAEEVKTDWIELELVDQDGRPVPHERYRITVPGEDRVREGFLDANGLARIDGIDPGTCTIAFPDFDASSWKPVEGDPGRRRKKEAPVRVQLHDPFYEPCRGQACRITGEGGYTEDATTDGDGWLECDVPEGLDRIVVTYTPPSSGVEYSVVSHVARPGDRSDRAYLAHLHNLGFCDDESPLRIGVLKFQAALDLELSGRLDDATKAAIDDIVGGELKQALGAGHA